LDNSHYVKCICLSYKYKRSQELLNSNNNVEYDNKDN